jgi:hypothetical protein
VLLIGIQDPVPYFFGSGIRDGKNPVPGSVMNIPDIFFEDLVAGFWVKNTEFFDADPDLGSCQPWIRDDRI